jgi:hypothetical protein
MYLGRANWARDYCNLQRTENLCHQPLVAYRAGATVDG